MKEHLQRHHSGLPNFVCSGTKQFKIVMAIYDADRIAGRCPMELLARSASLMRESICPALSPTVNYIDKDIRLLLTACGPKYVNAFALGDALPARRVGYLFYDRSFANLFFKELV